LRTISTSARNDRALAAILLLPFLLATGDLILKPDHHQEPNARAA
jgi:hypothetical protein